MNTFPIKTLVLCHLASIILLSECCHSNSSKVPAGYPFGDWQELTFTPIKTCHKQGNKWDYIDYMHSKNLITIKDRPACDTMMKYIDSTCNICREIDFNKNSILYLHGLVLNNSGREFYPRIIINHKTSTYRVELRGYTRHCNVEDGLNPSRNPADYYSQALLIPKPPDGYFLDIQTISPVQPSER